MSSIRVLRLATLLEGLSLLALVLIAMPMKYALGYPLAVRITGSVHGLLFLWFVASLVTAHAEHEWRLGRSVKLLIGAVIPFGFLYVEHALARDAGRD